MSCASSLGAWRVAPSRRSRRARGTSRGWTRVPTAAVPDVRPSSGTELLRRLDIDAPGWSGGYGTGGKVWSSSAVLCDWLVNNAAGLNLRGASVVELGSGTGVVGIACAALGASRVILSDGGSKSLLRLAKDNAAKNARAGNIDLDATDVTVCGYSWGAGEIPPEMISAAPFDVVVGSDCTYSVGGHGALCDSINALLACGRADELDDTREPVARSNPPVVILGHQHRTLAAALAGRGSSGWGKDPHLDMFVRTAARRGLRVEEMETKRLAWHGLRNVSVLRVTPADPERAQRDDADRDEPS